MERIFQKRIKKKRTQRQTNRSFSEEAIRRKKTTEKLNKAEKEFKTVHIEGRQEKSDRLMRDIKLILQGKEIKKLCDSEIRLIPQYDYTELVAFNEKVKACIMMQKQYLVQIYVMEVELDSVETKIKDNKNKTLREHILEMNKG